MATLKIFIVEDDKFFGEMLRHFISSNPDYEIELYSTGSECLKNIHKHPGVITLDYSLPDISGLTVLKKIKDYNPDIPVIIISGQEDVSTAIDLLKLGAYDYLVKDQDTKERLWNSLKNIAEKVALKNEISELKEEIRKKYSYANIIKGNSAPIKKLFGLIEKATNTNITISITGETGTGKDLVAKAIHYNSERSNHPFVAINVSAIPKDLIESEMFGYEKGAFTGAYSRKIGKFEAAGKGILFLDEVAEMDLNMQSKLLRVLQEKEFTRIGGNTVINDESRLIVSTNKDLSAEVRKGNFREDLYYRLLGLPIELPPLRIRGNDILILARYFIDEFCKDNGLETKSFSEDAQHKLMKYTYPGNVRELKAVIELSVVMSNTPIIKKDDISFLATNIRSGLMLEEKSLEEHINEIVKYYMEKYDDNVILVAEKLEIGKSTIYRKIKNNQI